MEAWTMWTSIQLAEQIARDSSCCAGGFNQRVLNIIPYLEEYDRMRLALTNIDRVAIGHKRGAIRIAQKLARAGLGR